LSSKSLKSPYKRKKKKTLVPKAIGVRYRDSEERGRERWGFGSTVEQPYEEKRKTHHEISPDAPIFSRGNKGGPVTNVGGT